MMNPQYWKVALKPAEDDQRPIRLERGFIVETSHDAVDLDVARADSLLLTYYNREGRNREMIRDRPKDALRRLVCLVANLAAATKEWSADIEPTNITETQSLEPRLSLEKPIFNDNGYRVWDAGL